MGLAKRENSGISISCCKQVWAWLKEAENTTESNEFSHYCGIQGALSPWNHHPLVRQNRSCLPICRYKRLRFPTGSEILASVCSSSFSQVQLSLCTAQACRQMNKINPKAWLQPNKIHETQRTVWNLKLPKSELQFSFYTGIWNTLPLVSGFFSRTPPTLKPLLLVFMPRLGHREESSGPPHPQKGKQNQRKPTSKIPLSISHQKQNLWT